MPKLPEEFYELANDARELASEAVLGLANTALPENQDTHSIEELVGLATGALLSSAAGAAHLQTGAIVERLDALGNMLEEYLSDILDAVGGGEPDDEPNLKIVPMAGSGHSN